MATADLTTAAAKSFRCPGETYDISESIHLGRLASFYAACRHCPHRHETAGLPTSVRARLQRPEATCSPGPLWTSEAACGTPLNELNAARVREIISWWVAADVLQTAAPVVVGGDGRSSTPELIAATIETLRLHGCQVVDLGAVSAGELQRAITHLCAAGGVLIGNHLSRPETVSLKFWSADAQPWSAEGELDKLVREPGDAAPRTSRRSASLARHSVGDAYRATLRGFFHGLRPLRFVVDTLCGPLVAHLQELTARSACQVLPPKALGASAANSAVAPSLDGLQLGEFESPYLRRRLARLAAQVCEDAADFGLWIDGDGESWQVIDERGRVVRPERLLVALARPLMEEQPGGVVVLEHETPVAIDSKVAALGGLAQQSLASRQAMYESLRRAGALIGGGPSGRIWLAGAAPTCDTLLSLSMLLRLLSESDLPLSEVLSR